METVNTLYSQVAAGLPAEAPKIATLVVSFYHLKPRWRIFSCDVSTPAAFIPSRHRRWASRTIRRWRSWS